MSRANRMKQSVIFLLISVAATMPLAGQTFTKLLDFNNGETGSSLIQGRDGYLYLPSAFGGSFGYGSISRIGLDGSLTTIYSFYGFSDGAYPADLVLGADGNFYGVTVQGGNSHCHAPVGCGTIFKLSSTGHITVLHTFEGDDGYNAYGGLTQAIGGSFYGATSVGGLNNLGTLYKITPGGAFTKLYDFDGADGATPLSPPIQASDGAFYGTTQSGGLHHGRCDAGCGTIYKLAADGKLTRLHSFHGEGLSPDASLLQASDMALYGTTYWGGDLANCEAEGCGTIFKIAPEGFTVVHEFEASDGEHSDTPLIQGTDGNLYGTTSLGGNLSCESPYGCGTLFQLNLDGDLSTLYVFGLTDGAGVHAPLLQATNGDFYGTTVDGGKFNEGTLFSLYMGLSPFVALVRPAGKVGQSGGILGQGFTGTTSVTLNGVPASFKVVSDTYLTATVPPGATTGYVTVTTPIGVLTSNKKFIVLP